MAKSILVPVDGSEIVSKALGFAATIARQHDGTIHLLHVFNPNRVPEGLEDYSRSEKIQETPQNVYLTFIGNRILTDSKDEIMEKGARNIETELVTGDPASEIISYAKAHQIDMIVMATRGLGSVTSQVCRETDRTCVIVKKALLDGKRVLIVDDEPDILETLEELLPMCHLSKSSTFEKARELLETEYFDIAVLDIMGVNGYELLEIANKRKVMAVMLTAHALSPEDTLKSFKRGAAYFVPKDKISDIVTYLSDVLEAKEKGKHFWWRWFDRFGYFYEKKFGSKIEGVTI